MISVDSFTHFYPRSYRRAAERVLPNLGGTHPFLRESLLTDLDMRLVANPPRSVQIISLPVIEEAEETMGTHTFEAANDELAQAVLDHPELFLGAVARLDMHDPAWSARYVTDTIARSDSLVGIQMLPRETGLPLTGDSFGPLFAAIDDSRRPVIVHPRSHARNMADCRDTWAQDLARFLKDLEGSALLSDHPHLRLILHGGSLLTPETLTDAISQIDGARRIFVDTALADATQIAAVADVIGPDHVLFSSEAPFAADGQDPLDMEAAAMQAVRDANLGGKATQDVLGGTVSVMRRTLPVNVKSEEDAYKEDKAEADRQKAAEDERRARELEDDSGDSGDGANSSASQD